MGLRASARIKYIILYYIDSFTAILSEKYQAKTSEFYENLRVGAIKIK